MEIERIRVKRLFIWKFTLTSFTFGLFLGLICSFILVLASLLGLGQTTMFQKQVDFLQPSFTFVFSLISTILLSVLFAFLGFLFAGFYNLLSRIGLNLDLGVSPVEQSESIREEPKNETETQIIQSAPSGQINI